jgi:asparagine synthase (glutamine-hydrolysing)
MPGIVGLITKKPRDQAASELRRMLDASSNESFYVSGLWCDDALGVYVGWRALRDSFAGEMPLRNERGDLCLVFSGEEYPDPDVVRRLKARGHEFDPAGSAYLVHLYEDDPAFPAGLNGLFHGLVVDQRRGTATLFNDRYGMHRLFWHQTDDTFYFAGEAKAILAVRPELRTPDPKSLGEFVACGCVLENRTLFKGISALPQGSAWTFRAGALERQSRYFDPREWEDQDALDPESYYQEIRETLTRNLPRYFAGRERIGMTLTGGLDTRVIMAWHKAAPGSLPCYTFGGKLRDSEDVEVARQVATLTGQSHEVIRAGDEFLRDFPRYAERSVYLSEGAIDVYRASDLYFSRQARAIAPVKVVGTYGSEIMRQVVNLGVAPTPRGLYDGAFLPHVAQAGETLGTLRRARPVTFAAFLQSPWQHAGILGLEQTQLTVRSPYLDNDFVRTAYRAPRINGDAGPGADIRLRLVDQGNPALAALRTDRGVGGRSGPLVSWSTRTLLELSVKAEYAYDYGMPQWLARVDNLLRPLRLETLFLGRHKSSYFRLWYRNELSAYVREMLLDPRTLGRPYLDRRGVEAIVRGHLKGTHNHTIEIHKLLTLELLHRQLLDAR